MTIDSAGFRRVLGHFVTGVTVITTRDAAGQPAGLTANAFASVSLDPPLVLVCVHRASDTHDLIAQSRAFAVNVLSAAQESVARRFAEEEKERRFEDVPWREESTGAPVFDDVLAWLDCRLHARTDGGDHTIYIGRVVAGGVGTGAPLLFYRGGYGVDRSP